MAAALHSLLTNAIFIFKVNITNSFQQENDDLTNDTKVGRLLRRSKRRWVITTLELQEEDPGPFPKLVGELFNNVHDNTELMYFISGPGVDEHPEIGLFSIEDHKNGKIYVHRPIDREKTPSFMICCDVAKRLTGKIVDKSLIVNIRVSDVNDHAPQFPEKEFNISVKENHDAGQPIFQMLAVDLDQENTPNSQVLYSLASQTPAPREHGFRIDRLSGEIRLSGCLDYETAPRFTLLIGARDRGDPPLSASATVHVLVRDSNTHAPAFAPDSYNIQVSEGQVSQGVLRLQVQDGDSPFTSAWKVKFNISKGDEEGHFDILTDPETNEGILNVIKPLDYETHPAWSLVVAMENEEPLFSCEAGRLQKPRRAVASATVSVQVTNANDPPAFHPATFIVSVADGAGPGIQLGIFNAMDPDRTASQIRYTLAYDPADWVTLDERSGGVITRKQVDRESPHVNDSFYMIIAHAVDDGVPPQTGTGTMLLFLSDTNDNAPTLHPGSRHLEVCESAGDEPLLIQAEDGDLEPFSDPFTFELDNTWGNTEDTWKLGENRGRSVELLMLRSLPRGDYSVPLFIGDKQGLSQKQTVHVRVCSCPDGFVCAEPSVAGAELPWGALAPVCAALVALAVALLFLLRCCSVSKAQRQGHPTLQEEGLQTLIPYNVEGGPACTQGRSDVRDQMPSQSANTTEAHTKLGAKGCGVLFEPRGVKNKYSTPVSTGLGFLQALSLCRSFLLLVAPLLLILRGPGAGWLCGADVWEDDPGCRPRVYTEEGECEPAESLSSLAFSEHNLLLDLLDSLGPKAAPLEEIYSETAILSLKKSIF
ncbi:cadherin-like protein 26 [Camelus dromedarius]|uniref:cadherin-like protein 26 n=1 Tax=Camelus dromedarius TaxID=9838 RepID=UPI00311A8FB8